MIGALPYWELGPWFLPGARRPFASAFHLSALIGLLVALAAGQWRATRKLGVDRREALSFSAVLFSVAGFFAHVVPLLLFMPGRILDNPLVVANPFGVISSSGGFVGLVVGFGLWRWWKPDRDLAVWADHAVWMTAFLALFARIGCGSVHDHLGVAVPARFPLALEMPADMGGGVRLDLGLLEALWWAVVAAVLLVLDRKPRAKGLYSALVPLLYAPVRFALDYFRLWSMPDPEGFDAPDHVEAVLGLFGVQPEALVQLGPEYHAVTAAALRSGEIPDRVLEEGRALFGDPRWLGLTPGQYASIVLLAIGSLVLWRVWDNPSDVESVGET